MDDIKTKVDDIMADSIDFIDAIKSELKSVADVVSIMEAGFNTDKTDEEKCVMLKHFFTLYWELFLASQELALVGDTSAFVVFIMLQIFCQISDDNATNKDIIAFANNLIKIFNETVDDGDKD